MKKIVLTLSILILFSSPSFSKDIIYECVFGKSSGFFKVIKNNNNTEVFRRENVKWTKWCSGKYEKSTILEEGAICNIEYHKIRNDPLTIMEKQTTTFDFLFKTITNVTKLNRRTYKCKIINK